MTTLKPEEEKEFNDRFIINKDGFEYASKWADPKEYYSFIASIATKREKELLSKIEEMIKTRLPKPMMEKEAEEFHCEYSILYWGMHLLQELKKLK